MYRVPCNISRCCCTGSDTNCSTLQSHDSTSPKSGNAKRTLRRFMYGTLLTIRSNPLERQSHINFARLDSDMRSCLACCSCDRCSWSNARYTLNQKWSSFGLGILLRGIGMCSSVALGSLPRVRVGCKRTDQRINTTLLRGSILRLRRESRQGIQITLT